MKQRLLTLALFSFGSICSVACGSSDDSTSGTAGSSSQPTGGAGVGGSAGASSAGAGGKAAGGQGGAPSGGSAGTSGSSAGATPTGPVSICNGQGCPYGTCDNNSATTKCSTAYPGALDASSMLCKSDGEYCLITGSAAPFAFWAVRCASGVASSEKCDSSCGYGLGHATCS